jgi:hypothetical protein
METPKTKHGDASVSTPFHESLAVLNARVEQIPFGWQSLYTDMRLKLRASFCEGREAIVIRGAYEQDGCLCVESQAPDFVIQGILRKARARAAFTCMECGEPGKHRELEDWVDVVLCGTCAGPRLLQSEIRRLLALDRCATLDDCRDPLGGPHAPLLRAAADASGQVSAEDRRVVCGQLSAGVRVWATRLLDHVQSCTDC